MQWDALRDDVRSKLEMDGITGDDAAAAIGISNSSLSRFLGGKIVTVEGFERITSWLNGSMDDYRSDGYRSTANRMITIAHGITKFARGKCYQAEDRQLKAALHAIADDIVKQFECYL